MDDFHRDDGPHKDHGDQQDGAEENGLEGRGQATWPAPVGSARRAGSGRSEEAKRGEAKGSRRPSHS